MFDAERVLASIDPDWFTRPDGSVASGGIHGIGHTKRVLLHTLDISAGVGVADWERQAAVLAAAWHDIGRVHDGADYYHGALSAGKVVGLGLQIGIEPRVRDAALFAVTHHSGSEVHAERDAEWNRDGGATLRVFQILKDADALDRVRLGDLDTDYLRFEYSVTRVDRAWELFAAVR